jgi:hypothetical protein
MRSPWPEIWWAYLNRKFQPFDRLLEPRQRYKAVISLAQRRDIRDFFDFTHVYCRAFGIADPRGYENAS